MNVTFLGKWCLEFDPGQTGSYWGSYIAVMPQDGLPYSAVATSPDGQASRAFIVYMVEGDRSRIILQSNESLAFLSVMPAGPGLSVLGANIPTPPSATRPEGADGLTISETGMLLEGDYVHLQYQNWGMVWQGQGSDYILYLSPTLQCPVPQLRMTYHTHSLATIVGSKNAQGYDLMNVILRGVDLRGCNFSNASFNGADLTGANLSNCDCSGAQFLGANLTNAIFTDANLNLADFRDAIVSGMDLRSSSSSRTGTQLVGANFSGLDLRPVYFDPVPHFSTDRSRRTLFVGATIPYAALGHSWSCLDLRNARVPDLPATLSGQGRGHAQPRHSVRGAVRIFNQLL